MVMKFGLPYVLEWIKRHFPWFPVGETGQILYEYAVEIKDHKKEAKERVKDKLKNCSGIGCPSDLVKE